MAVSPKKKKKSAQQKEYAKSKPFSRAGRMRAASVAMGVLKGPTPDRRAGQQSTRAEEEAAERETAATERAAHRGTPPRRP